MLAATTIKRINTLGILSNKGKRINGLFRLMENPCLWMQAYSKIYANKGATTPGIDGKTLDGFSKERVGYLIEQLKQDHYRFKPAKRIYIPKANGKQRPLGIPSGDDKLVAEVVRMILERIYEPIFCKNAHGFRPGKSCHTALRDIQHQWTGMKWIIDMDVQSFFDNIDHAILISLLKNKIDDKRFINLIELMLQAGYVENWKFHKTYSGAAQGSGISPLLANIYLHELDQFVEEIQVEFNRGKKRASRKKYACISTTLSNLRKKVDNLKQQENTEEQIQVIKYRIKALDLKQKETVALDPLDPNFKRLRYCRYADDFVIGIIGSKQDAITLRDKIQKFIEAQLHLNIAPEKSYIVHGQKGARFLGYDIRIYSDDKIVKTIKGGRHCRVRSMTNKMQLHIPHEKIKSFCKSKKYGNYGITKARHRPELLNLSDAEIVETYNAELQGLANYYALSQNYWDLSKIAWIWQKSLLKTLAAKHKTTSYRIWKQLKTPSGLALTVRSPKKIRLFKIFNIKDIDRETPIWGDVDQKANTRRFTWCKTELIKRLNAEQCEYCGQRDGKFEVHHIRKLSDIKDGRKMWQIIMARKKRKTLVLCTLCHKNLHTGILPDWRNPTQKRVESRMN